MEQIYLQNHFLDIFKTATYEIIGYSYAIIVKNVSEASLQSNVANFTKRFTNL